MHRKGINVLYYYMITSQGQPAGKTGFLPLIHVYAKQPSRSHPMKRNITRILVFIILFALLPLHPVSAADYSSYSNSSKSWGLYSKSDHSTPGGSTSSSTLKNYGAYYLGDTSKKTCYLTFDCGYEYGNTPTILDTLKKYEDLASRDALTSIYASTYPTLV